MESEELNLRKYIHSNKNLGTYTYVVLWWRIYLEDDGRLQSLTVNSIFWVREETASESGGRERKKSYFI